MHKAVDKTHSLELFLDLDGVFADFNGRVRHLTGQEPYQLQKKHMWAAIHADREFFLNLELLHGAEQLWEFCKTLSPKFLTGAPSSEAFREQKAEWVRRKFGHEWTTIVLPKKDKQLYSGFNKVLIDDSIENIEQWVAKGGHGILYTGEADEAIAKLQEFVDNYHRFY